MPIEDGRSIIYDKVELWLWNCPNCHAKNKEEKGLPKQKVVCHHCNHEFNIWSSSDD